MPIRKVSRYGWRRDHLDQRDVKMLDLHVLSAGPLPPAFNVKMVSELPPVYDQGELGSCTANAIAAAKDFQRHKQGRPFMNPSRLFIYYGERVLEGDPLSDNGAEIRDGMKVVSAQGCPMESVWPYYPSMFAHQPPPTIYQDALKFKTLRYTSVPQQLEHLKTALAAWKVPVVFGFSVFEAFESDQVAASGIVPMPDSSDTPIGGHAVCLVGYDDAIKRFTVRNSWGESWGQKGYFTMPYDYVLSASLASDFWTLNEEE